MSDQPEDQNGTADEVTETAPDAQVAAWPEPADGPAWENIGDQAESSAPGPAGPGASPEGAAPEQGPSEARPATEAGRSHRPTSLRDQYVPDSESVPRRKLSAPAFPTAASVPGSQVAPPVSEPTEPGNHGQVPHPRRGHLPSPASLLGKLPTDKLPTDKISMRKLPLEKLSVDRLPVDKLRTLTKQRPEVGLGLAFASGLVIATILKRLGRR
ncbi:MAG: hypothetical protein ACRDLT_01115 [Solirubrobacteraceae bacterium]